LVTVVCWSNEPSLNADRVRTTAPGTNMGASSGGPVTHPAVPGSTRDLRIVAAPEAIPRLHQSQSPSRGIQNGTSNLVSIPAPPVPQWYITRLGNRR
jgi:hypothetical protein